VYRLFNPILEEEEGPVVDWRFFNQVGILRFLRELLKFKRLF
jgi:hypothetical protein